MKRLLLLLLLPILIAGYALADQAEELALQLHPGCQVMQRLDAGDTALLVLGEGEQRILVIAENGRVTVDNPTALLSGLLPKWSFTDEAAAWSYDFQGEERRYHAQKEDGGWRLLEAVTVTEDAVRSVSWANGLLYQSVMQGGQFRWLTPIYAPWLMDNQSLAVFDASLMPTDLSLLTAAAYQPIADALLDGMNVAFAHNGEDGLLILCDKPNNVGQILCACEWIEHEYTYQVTRSTTLTNPCQPASRDGRLCLTLNDCDYSFGKNHTGSWGIVSIRLPDALLQLDGDHMGCGVLGLEKLLWGSHPWSDMTRLDWLSLPRNYSEAIARHDPSGWAMVANPDEADTLNLRQKPDSKAYSLGRYVNGAPMQILSSNKDWLQVSIGGVTGWMRKDYVAQAHAMQDLHAELNRRTVAAKEQPVPLYGDLHSQAVLDRLHGGETVLILGAVQEKWYHVLVADTWQYGFIDRSALK